MSETIAGLVSIVIPCYKGERYLAQAIESCLRQTYASIEIIVVDDASPDRCAQIAEDYAKRDARVRVIRRETNGGVSRAFDTGFDAARGEYLTRLAQDDLFREDAVALMQAHLAAHADLGLVYCDVQTMNERGDVTGIKPALEPNEALAHGNQLGLCVMWRRSVRDRLGKFDPSYDAAEDYEYWLRIARHYRIDKCARGEAPFFFRFHENMGSTRFLAKQELAVHRARAVYCGRPLLAMQLMSRGHFEAAYQYRLHQQWGRALKHLAKAIGYWPFSIRNYRCLAGLVLMVLTSRQNINPAAAQA
jgi:glycosyltransferase involved in cell wall biosynthesis